jgi:CubicO group peptidase (beta-lactamase class C family)
MNDVTPPSFSTPDVGYYASWVLPNAGWDLIWGNFGDANSNPASTASGAVVKRTGMYSVTGTNIVEAWADPNYYWIYQGSGIGPLGATYHDASTTPTNGNCYFNVTIGNALRKPIPGVPIPPLPPPTTARPLPASTTLYSLNVTAFADNVKNALNAGTPAPVGFQLAVRDPQGKLVYSSASGSVTGSSALPPTPMTKSRRFDTASMSKTIMATAVMAAFEDLADHKPPLGVTLDSSIVPYVPSNWDTSKIGNVTFRSLLRHTSGFVANGGDSYGQVKTMVENGPNSSNVGKWSYYDSNYALLRIVLAYLVDGPEPYKPFEANPTLNAQITALSYRNYVRCKIFDPIGLSAVDEFYTGSLPETIYFDKAMKAIPDNINIPGTAGYDQTSNHMVLTAGSGNWTLSAEEYSLFISNLWLGKIVSPASVTEMLAQNDPNAMEVGMGMYGSKLVHDGKTWWDYNHNGAGGYGGPQGIWMTFFNGYTAVLLSNTDWGLGGTLAFTLMENSFAPALTP